MKKHLFLLLLLSPLFVLAQTGKVMDNLSLESKILKMERNYAVYLPPGYESSERSYPILYLLHGATDDHTGWVQFGEVLHITDKAIRDGIATPMVIVMPDADTKVMGYFNVPDWDYENFFFEEFIPHIEQKYRVKGTKRFRAVAGLSMGGGGSFMYALRHPDMFSSACPLSAYVGPLSLEQASRSMKRRMPDVTDEQVEYYFNNYSALNLLAMADVDEVKSVRWYIDCGDDDFLYEGNSRMHIEMRKKEIPHQYRVRDGGHSWTYWRDSLPQVLRFISDSFHQN